MNYFENMIFLVNTVEEGNRPRFKTQSKADIKSLTSKFESVIFFYKKNIY